ncbi:hypothetical protein GJ744_001961 [Endocarpon pusillum]|uniref:Uncharacterized protein n=1 Tax=Endocarpon pusillum TaxID=364733 RepID=A0A8H7AGD2_9EURO|nr:hypothetical protein GJ744_001961 [Endocarpon pusillum]
MTASPNLAAEKSPRVYALIIFASHTQYRRGLQDALFPGNADANVPVSAPAMTTAEGAATPAGSRGSATPTSTAGGSSIGNSNGNQSGDNSGNCNGGSTCNFRTSATTLSIPMPYFKEMACGIGVAILMEFVQL